MNNINSIIGNGIPGAIQFGFSLYLTTSIPPLVIVGCPDCNNIVLDDGAVQISTITETNIILILRD